MKALIISSLLVASAASAEISPAHLIPSQSFATALDVAQLFASRRFGIDDLRINSVDGFLGKFGENAAGYSLRLNLGSPSTHQIISCEGSIEIIHAPPIKHRPDGIEIEISIETDGNVQMENYANMLNFHCKR